MKVIKLSATWCGPCKAIQPMWETLKESYPNVEFEEKDADADKAFVEEEGIRSVPTFIVEYTGARVTFPGPLGINAVEELIKGFAE
jgi:thioredoxin 1